MIATQSKLLGSNRVSNMFNNLVARQLCDFLNLSSDEEPEPAAKRSCHKDETQIGKSDDSQCNDVGSDGSQELETASNAETVPGIFLPGHRLSVDVTCYHTCGICEKQNYLARIPGLNGVMACETCYKLMVLFGEISSNHERDDDEEQMLNDTLDFAINVAKLKGKADKPMIDRRPPSQRGKSSRNA